MKGRPVQKTGKHAGKPYRKSQKAYAVDYGVSLPTVKRWWRKGLPCDDADAMGEFLSNRGRKPGESDEEFDAPSIVPPGAGDGENTAAGTDEDQEPPSPVRLDEDFFQGKGFLAEIERLKKAARERSAAYFTAILHRQNSTKIRNRLSEWTSVLEALRKLEKDAPGIRKANDLTVDVAEMDAAIGQTLQAFRAAANIGFRRLIEKLGHGDDLEAQDLADKERDALLKSLTDLTATAAEEAKAKEPAEPGTSADA